MCVGLPPMYDLGSIGEDLKRFGSTVSEEKLDENKSKRHAKIFVKILLKIQIGHRA